MSYWDTLAGGQKNTMSGQLNTYKYDPANPATPHSVIGGTAAQIAAAMVPQKPAAPKPAPNFLASMFQDSAGAQAKSMQPAAPQPSPILPNNYASGLDTLQQNAQGRLNALASRRSQLAGMSFQRQADPYAQGGTAYTAAMNNALSQPSGLLQNALANTQRSMAERGITADSGLAVQAGNQARLEAAKMGAAAGGQVAQDYSQRSAQFNDMETQRGREFDQNRAQLLDAFDTGNYQLADSLTGRLQSLNNDQYGRRLDAGLDPLRLQEAQQGITRGDLQNQDSSTRLRFLQPMLQQQQDTGGLQLDTLRQTQPGMIAAQNAQSGYQTADANALSRLVAAEDTPEGRNRRAARQFQQDMAFGQQAFNQFDLPGQIRQQSPQFLGMAFGGGGIMPR